MKNKQGRMGMEGGGGDWGEVEVVVVVRVMGGLTGRRNSVCVFERTHPCILFFSAYVSLSLSVSLSVSVCLSHTALQLPYLEGQ